jgi:hypothetical protein
MAKRRKPRTSQQVLSREQINISREAGYILHRAQDLQARLVTLGALILFSTETGDAWMLDPQDGLALCLARAGDPQPFTITETATRFAIEWNAHYRIEGAVFTVAEQSGQVRSILGYPTQAIMQAARRVS